MKKYYEDVSHQPEDGSKYITVRRVNTDAIMCLRPVELPATGWVKITPDRKPTVEDADEDGHILVRHPDHEKWVWADYDGEDAKRATHFHPIAKFQEDKRESYGEWIMWQDGYHHLTTDEQRIEWHNKKHAEYALQAKEGE